MTRGRAGMNETEIASSTSLRTGLGFIGIFFFSHTRFLFLLVHCFSSSSTCCSSTPVRPNGNGGKRPLSLHNRAQCRARIVVITKRLARRLLRRNGSTDDASRARWLTRVRARGGSRYVDDHWPPPMVNGAFGAQDVPTFGSFVSYFIIENTPDERPMGGTRGQCRNYTGFEQSSNRKILFCSSFIVCSNVIRS